MDMKAIDAAMFYYSRVLDEADNERLSFFKQLWELQDELSGELAPAYEAPSEGEVIACANELIPVLSMHPVTITREALCEAMERIAKLISTSEQFPGKLRKRLKRVEWEELVFASKTEIAGKKPEGYLSDFFTFACVKLADDELGNLVAMVASLALRALLEKPAQAIMEVAKGTTAYDQRPVHCPVCGGEATVARVGLTEHNDGRAKELWCGQCGTAWEFQRVRCARCGDQNQVHMHYFNIEGDDAHRLQTCDACGGYMRTLFQDNALAPLSFDVENVVMAKLDEVAYQHAKKKLENDGEEA